MKVPEGWKIAQIQNVAKVNADTLSSNSDPDHKYLYIDLSAVDKGIVTMPQERQKLTDLPSRARRVLHKNDVIMTTVRPNLLGFALCDYEPDDVLCSTGFALLSPKGSSDAGFIYQSLYSDAILRQLHGLVTGSNYPAINTSEVKKLKLLWPQSKTERRKIAEILSTWDEAMALTGRHIEAARQRKKSLIQLLLTCRLRFPEFVTEEWKETSLGNILETRDERITPSQNLELYSLTIEDGITPKIKRYDRQFLVKSKSKKYKGVHPGDIVYNPPNLRYGAISASRAKEAVLVSPTYEVLYVRNPLMYDVDFVTNLVTSDRQIKLFSRFAEGTLVERMSVKLDDFLACKVRIPKSTEEQRRIAAVLQTCDREIGLLTQKRDALQRQKKGLMQWLLTGRVRIRV